MWLFLERTLSSLLCLHLWMDFNITSHTNVGYHTYDNILSMFNFQGPGLKVKVNVAIFRKTLSCSSALIYHGF